MIGFPMFHTNNIKFVLVCNCCYPPAAEINLNQMPRLRTFLVFASSGLFSNVVTLCPEDFSRRGRLPFNV